MSHIDGFEVFAEHGMYGDEARLWFHQSHPSRSLSPADREYTIMDPVNPTIRQETPGVSMREPTFRFSWQQAETMMTALWKIGVRPHGITGDDTERVTLLKAHIKSLEEQMRALYGVTDKHIELLKGAQEVILGVTPPSPTVALPDGTARRPYGGARGGGRSGDETEALRA